MRKQRGICSIEGCGKPHRGHGWCGTHYNRWYERGTLETKLRTSGTGCITKQGYHTLHRDGIQKAIHTRIAEAALGKPLPRGAIVHHSNEDKGDNRPENLVICTQSYHRLLHQRINAYKACGHADWRRCRYCKGYDDPANLRIIPGNKPGRNATIYHRDCVRIASRIRDAAR